MISVFIFTSNDFRPWKIEERERERARRSPSSKQEDRIRARRSHRSNHSNPSSSNPVTDHRDRLAIFGPRAKREIERVERSSHHQWDRLAIVLEPARTRSPTNPLALRRSHRRVTLQTHEPEIVAPRTVSRTAPIAPASRTTNLWTHYRFVLALVWNFCNKICLWFWFFNFSLWSLILLLLLWWCGWWCFSGFPVMWWWVLWWWWWKIAFSECYQTYEIIF